LLPAGLTLSAGQMPVLFFFWGQIFVFVQQGQQVAVLGVNLMGEIWRFTPISAWVGVWD